MLEKEVASIVRFVLDSAEELMPYYHNIPESFTVPSVFFPSPEISFRPDTFSAYSGEYTMFAEFFHSSTELAYQIALLACNRINAARRLVPEINYDGKSTGRYIRIENTQPEKADECAYQLQIDWVSRYPYTPDEGVLIRNFYLNGGKL